MGWKYHSPPGWPAPPEDWTPPPGWRPDASWPPAPDGWQFWISDGADDPTLLFELTDEDGFAAGPLDSVDDFVREQAEQGDELPVAGVPLGEPAPVIAPVWAAEPGVTEPVQVEPVAVEPVAAVVEAEPVLTELASADPAAADPAAAEPVTAEPAAPPPIAEPVAGAATAEPVPAPDVTTAEPSAEPVPEPVAAPAMTAEPIHGPTVVPAMIAESVAESMAAPVMSVEPVTGPMAAPAMSAEADTAPTMFQEIAGQTTGEPEAAPSWRDERPALNWPADPANSAEPAWAAADTAEPRPEPPVATPVYEPPPVAAPVHEPVPEPAMSSSAGFIMGTGGPAVPPVGPPAHVPAHAAPHVPAHAAPVIRRPWRVWALGGAAGLLLCSVLGAGGFLALRPDRSSVAADPSATAVQAPSEAVPSQEAQGRPIPSPGVPIPPVQPQDQVFEGVGSQTVPVELGDTFHTVALTYAGAGDFVVRTVKADGQEIQTLVATTDSYEGVRPLDLGDIRPAAVNIEAAGGWRMVVRPLAASPTFSGTASGVGADVLLIPRTAADTTRVAFDHRGKGKFTVQAIGSDSATLISQEGDFTGETVLPRGTVVLVIETSGVWTFSRD